MISRKELDYVSFWANRVPYPGVDYSEASMAELKEAFDKYNSLYKGIEYNIAFSNSEEIQLKISTKNLAHMLGIDYKNIMNEYHRDFRKNALGIDPNEKISSFMLLNSIVENIDRILDYEKDNGNKDINFYKIRVKCAIFDKIADISNFKFGCINFNNQEYAMASGAPFSGNSSKFLFTQSNEAVCPYFMMGILKNDEKINSANVEESEDIDGKYYVETLFAPVQPVDFFINQEVVIPTQILYDQNDVLQKIIALPEEKRRMISMYKEIIDQFQIQNNLNIFGDYLSLLGEQENYQKLLKRG